MLIIKLWNREKGRRNKIELSRRRQRSRERSRPPSHVNVNFGYKGMEGKGGGERVEGNERNEEI